jgi:hypothetical protein
MHCACHDWTRQGTEGFLGYDMCQGPDAWPQGEVSIMRLDPDGCLVRRHRASDITIAEDTGAGETANRQRDAMRHTSAKKCKRVCKGEVFPLDRSLLMGVPPLHDDDMVWVRQLLATE